jgi:hypothetical protein
VYLFFHDFISYCACVVAALAGVYLDTFNSLIQLNFDNRIELSDLRLSGFVIESGGYSVTLDDTIQVSIAYQTLRIVFGTTTAKGKAIQQLIKPETVMSLRIDEDAYNFTTSVVDVTGTFEIGLFCKLCHDF